MFVQVKLLVLATFVQVIPIPSSINVNPTKSVTASNICSGKPLSRNNVHSSKLICKSNVCQSKATSVKILRCKPVCSHW